MLDLKECPCSGRNLDKLLAPAILLQLVGGELHGYEIVRQLGDLPLMGGRRPDGAGVYRILRDMEGRGILASAWATDDSGPAKRCYRLTGEGRRCLARWQATLEEHAAALNDLLDRMRNAARRRASKGGRHVQG